MNAKEALTQWLASGDLERTLQGLEVVFEQQNIKRDERLVIQQSRFHTLQSEHAQGTISHADYTLEFSKIRKAVQELVNGLADHWSAEGLERIAKAKKAIAGKPAKVHCLWFQRREMDRIGACAEKYPQGKGV